MKLTPQARLSILVGLLVQIGGAAITYAAAKPVADLAIRLASGKVHVPVRLGDRESWWILDSGANMSIVDRSLAIELGYELRGGGTADGAAGGASFTFAFTTLPSLRLGALELVERGVAVIERRTQPANGHPSEGLLGADLFARYVVEIDYAGGRLRLHEPDEWSYQGDGAVLPIRLDENGKTHVDAWVRAPGRAPIPADLIVDTGSRGFIDFTAPFTAEHGLAEGLAESALTTVGVGVGGPVEHWVGRLEGLRLGTLEIDGPVATFAPPGTGGSYGRADRAGIVGGALLHRFWVVFDYRGKRLILESRDGTAPIEWDMSGLFLASAGADFDRLRVLDVAAGSPAAEVGVLVDDEIVSIDAEPAARSTLDEARARLQRPGPVTLGLLRGGKHLEVRLELARRF